MGGWEGIGQAHENVIPLCQGIRMYVHRAKKKEIILAETRIARKKKKIDANICAHINIM